MIVRREIITPELLGELQTYDLLKRERPVDLLDLLFVVRMSGQPVGCQALRPMYYSHSLEVTPGVRARPIVDALFAFTEGFCAHARDFSAAGGFAPAGTLFHCLRDNATIQKYMLGRGARLEALDPLLFRYDLP